MRKRITALERRLNELSEGLFFGEFLHRGLSTFRLRELQRLAKQVGKPEFIAVLRITARELLKFYIRLRRGLEGVLADRGLETFLRICRWLGIDLEEAAQEALREDNEHLKRIGWWPPPGVQTSCPRGQGAETTVPPKMESAQDTVLGGSSFWVEAKYVPCYRPNCRKCPHGPYLYLRWRDSLGRKHSKYLGRGEACLKRLHDLAGKLGIPADVVRSLEQQIKGLPPKTGTRLRGHFRPRR